MNTHQRFSIFSIKCFTSTSLFSSVILKRRNTFNTGTGKAWADANASLHNALSTSTASDEIRIAEGTYYPDEDSGQTNNLSTSAFCMNSGIDMYGEFAGQKPSAMKEMSVPMSPHSAVTGIKAAPKTTIGFQFRSGTRLLHHINKH